MILAKTRYKTYDNELLAIVEVFKTWYHYLEGCKYKVFIFTNHNNFHHFMDIKSLSSCQVWWAQKLSCYYFQIDYRQEKANGAANALSCFPQQDYEKEANFQAENTWIFYCLQFLLTNASISGIYATVSSLSPQHQILICKTFILPQLRHFWIIFQTKLANEKPDKASIGSMRVKLQELHRANSEAQELKQQKTDGYKEIDEILYHQDLPFIPKAIQTELISRHHTNFFVGYFGITKTCELLVQKYYWLILRHNVKAFIKGCNVCLALKIVRYNPYGDLQLLPVPTHWWKDLLINFVTGLLISID